MKAKKVFLSNSGFLDSPSKLNSLAFVPAAAAARVAAANAAKMFRLHESFKIKGLRYHQVS